MGSPELPNDTGDEDLRTNHIVHHPPAAMSDDSDNEGRAGNDYNGYQPLSMDENGQEYGSIALQEDEGDDDEIVQGFNRHHQRIHVEQQAPSEEEEPVEVTHGDPNLPAVESIDAEVEREVWSQPRPQELQIELDSNKTQQVSHLLFLFIIIRKYQSDEQT